MWTGTAARWQSAATRDGKRTKLQIEFGLLCDREGCPVALEVFDGNIVDCSLPPRGSPAAGPHGSRAGRRS